MSFDAVLIPGGGLLPDGNLPDWVHTRLEAARQAAGDAVFIVLSAGTVHKPPVLDPAGFPITEADAAAKALINGGVPASRVWVEGFSLDTIGNAYFSRMIHVEPNHFRRLLVVTSEFHMPRTRAIFEWVYRLDPPDGGYDLSFLSSVNNGMAPELLAARIRKEDEALNNVIELQREIKTLTDFHAWLFVKHAAYSANRKFTRLESPEAGSY